MVTILCNRNEGYYWIEDEGCHFKGYLQSKEGIVIRGKEAIEFFASVKNYDQFLMVLKEYYGVFSVVIERNNEVWMAVDIARSMPIYYTCDLRFISDNIDTILQNYNKESIELDTVRIFEMYTTSFVGFQNTVYKNIKQLELGHSARILTDRIEQTPYYIHGNNQMQLGTASIQHLINATDHMINRLLRVVNGRQIVLSLSGGYDSRYLACSLKKNGVDRVICYTYGRVGSYEVIQSKKVADALGYEWYNIEYDDESVRKILNEEGKYLDYANRPDYIVYLQNYLAVKYLHNNHLIPKESVFLTGLCNDMPTGYYIPKEEDVRQYGYNIEGVADYNYKQRFTKFNVCENVSKIYKKDVIDYLIRLSVEVNDYQSFVSALDCLETANYHTHCYLNMNTVHDFFGYEWLLPCWDKELLQFWYTVPAKERIGQKTYEEYIINTIGARYGIGTKKHINLSASTPFKRRLKRLIGGLLVKIAYPLGIPMRRNTDINNMAILEVKLYKAIKQKQAIKSDRAALILLLTIYMMERRYGIDWYKKIKEYLD